MDRFAEFGPFKIHVSPQKIILSKGRSEIMITASQAAIATSLLSAVVSAGDVLKHLPHLQSTPFRVIVKKDFLVLITKGMTKGGLVFLIEDIDALIVTINTAVQIWTDLESLDISPKRPQATGWETPEVPIDGNV